MGGKGNEGVYPVNGFRGRFYFRELIGIFPCLREVFAIERKFEGFGGFMVLPMRNYCRECLRWFSRMIRLITCAREKYILL